MPEGTADRVAAARRTAQRTDRVVAGLPELDTWLADQVRTGLARLERVGYGHFEAVAARMADAQALRLSGRLRGMRGTVASGEGWASRLLEDLPALRLTVAGHARLGALPADLAACVRREVGHPVAKDEVLAPAAVRHVWSVVRLRDTQEDRLSTRRVWLYGSVSARMALVLSFAPSGQALDASLVPGTALRRRPVDHRLAGRGRRAALRRRTGHRHRLARDGRRRSAGAHLRRSARRPDRPGRRRRRSAARPHRRDRAD